MSRVERGQGEGSGAHARKNGTTRDNAFSCSIYIRKYVRVSSKKKTVGTTTFKTIPGAWYSSISIIIFVPGTRYVI